MGGDERRGDTSCIGTFRHHKDLYRNRRVWHFSNRQCNNHCEEVKRHDFQKFTTARATHAPFVFAQKLVHMVSSLHICLFVSLVIVSALSEESADPPEKRAADLLKKMTTAEKFSMVYGIGSVYAGTLKDWTRLRVCPLARSRF